MSNLRMAAVASFSAVTDTMNGIGTGVRAVAKSATALDKYVDQILYKQEKDYAVERAVYGETAERKAAENMLREEERMSNWFDEKEGREKRYSDILTEVKKKVAELEK